MSPRRLLSLVLLFPMACGVASTLGEIPEQEPRDSYGDPLPKGARWRGGTPRLTHGGPVHHAAIHPSGKTVVTVDGDIRIWSLEDGRLLRTIPAEDAYSVLCHPDGRRILTWSPYRGTIRF